MSIPNVSTDSPLTQSHAAQDGQICESPLALWRNAHLCTMVGQDWDLIENGAVVVRAGRIEWLGPLKDLPSSKTQDIEQEIDVGGALLSPALIDCHTHLVYAGDRAAEAEMRLAGASYESILQAGGGILSTVKATRESSQEVLVSLAKQRAVHLRQNGVASLEIKSGYGLRFEDEARMLRAARALAAETALSVQTTYLAAHALPPEFAGQADAYIDAVCDWLPQLHAQGLVDAVDAFCERIAFSPAQVERVFQAARALQLPVKLHAEQLSNSGGALLAAQYKALSCDHVEYVNDADIQAMKQAGCTAVLLPGAFYALREVQIPPVSDFRSAGVPMAIASDHNPGTAPMLSLTMMMHMATTLFRLSAFEAWQGVTVHAARALGLGDRGQLRPGLRADFAVWDMEHPRELVYWMGHNPCRYTVIAGQCFRTPYTLSTPPH